MNGSIKLIVNSSDIVFEKNLEFYTSVDETNNEICVVLSDDLNASEEDLTEKYKSQIVAFISDYSKWYEKALNAITGWSKKEYSVTSERNNIQLVNIFILFEQGENELYGLEFGIDYDIEHGCGLKMNNDGFQVIEIGNADVAFC